MLAVLVADIGGTNTRIALAASGRVLPASVTGYSNDEFGSFYEVLGDFLQRQNNPRFQSCCIAVAGPVTSQIAVLTNRSWRIETEKLAALTGASHIILMNDLLALGHAVAHLDNDDLVPINTNSSDGQPNGQSLVLGIGTGLNLCAIKRAESMPAAFLQAEFGHCELPVGVARILAQAFGDAAQFFTTAEDCFSGRGLSRIHSLVSGQQGVPGDQILAAYESGREPTATQTVDLFTELTGALCRQLIFQYMPLDGIYFAGGVARGLFQADTRSQFLRSYIGKDQFADILPNIPMSLIVKDEAALAGCAQAASDTGAFRAG